MEFLDIEAYSYSRDGLPPYMRSPTIWGHIGAVGFPLCYLRKPKSLSNESWEQFLDVLEIYLKKPSAQQRVEPTEEKAARKPEINIGGSR